MPKLQRIKRTNGTYIYSINFPSELIEDLCWEKGSEITMKLKEVKSHKIVIIFKSNELNLEDNNGN